MTKTDEKVRRLRSIFESVADGSEFVERQRDDGTRELTEDVADRVFGPAELHGLTDSIDDPDPDPMAV